jgi:hypothetical protein
VFFLNYVEWKHKIVQINNNTCVISHHMFTSKTGRYHQRYLEIVAGKMLHLRIFQRLRVGGKKKGVKATHFSSLFFFGRVKFHDARLGNKSFYNCIDFGTRVKFIIVTNSFL